MRTRFQQGRRLPAPRRHDQDFRLEAPPELPRTIEVGTVRAALPWLFGIVIVVMIIMMFVMGFGSTGRNPIYLFFMAMMGVSLFTSMQNQGGSAEMSTAEVNSERAEYLRYLSGKGEEIRAAATAQKKAAAWAHPAPTALEAILGTRRMWERGPNDPDFLHIRVGRDDVKLANKFHVKHVDSELDLEPVAMVALQHMRSVQQSIPHCPMAVDFSAYGLIGVHGDRELFLAAARAWIAQTVCWHSPSDSALAVVSPQLEAEWGWAKWLPHTESQDIDGAGPARMLATSLADIEATLDSLLKERAKLVDDKGTVDVSAVSKEHKHVVVIIDDPAAPAAAVRRVAARDGVTVIDYRSGPGPDRDHVCHDRELLLRISPVRRGAEAAAQLDYWHNFTWQSFCAEPDVLDTQVVAHLGRQMSKWDATPISRQSAESASAQNMLSLMGIRNAANLDVAALWVPRALPVGTGETVNLDPLLRVPIGLQPSGAPLTLDLKDEADGGNGPHGLMIGMTGSGKSTALAAMALGLFTQHSPDVVQAILCDFKDGAGFDAFADWPHVVAVVTNLEEKKSLVERFGETLLGVLEQRGEIFAETGRRVKGAAFESLREYNEFRATPDGQHLPPVPFLFVWVDEFSLMLKDHPGMADVFDTVTRKGRSQGVFFLFASQTLDEGVVKRIPDNTQFRIGLKVASESTSRRVIGTPDAFHIPDGKHVKGTGYFVRAPGAEPVKYRGFRLPTRYEPPTTISRTVINATPRARLFTAGRVEPDSDTVIEEEIRGETVLAGPPRSLILTVGPQLAAAYGERPQQLWAPPLDDPIPLDDMLRIAEGAPARSGGPWWPLGKVDRPKKLRHDLLSYSVDDGHLAIVGKAPEELSSVVQTFVLAAAARYSPTDVGFFAFGYGGPALAAVKGLPHLGALGGKDRKELTARMFGDLDALVTRRRRLFERHDIGSLAEYRRKRQAGDAALDDGYPTDLFVIIDGWESFLDDNTSVMNPKNPHLKNVVRLFGAGHGVHLLVTASDWIKLNPVEPQLSVKYELKLSSPTQSAVRAQVDDKMTRPQERIPVNAPGRGITARGEVIRFAVGRLDGVPSMDDLDVKVREAVSTIAQKYPDAAGIPEPQLLPGVVDPVGLQDGLTGECFAVGRRGSDLAPLVVDFAVNPLLAAYGDDGQGKSTLIRNLVRSVVARRRGPDDAMIVLFDKSRELSDLTHLLVESDPSNKSAASDYYQTDFAGMATNIAVLAGLLDSRTPPADLSWEQKRSWKLEGPKIYLFVDDVDGIHPQATVYERPVAGGDQVARQVAVWQPLLRHLANARDIGLRVIITHRANGIIAEEASRSSIPGEFSRQSSQRILLAAKTETDKVGGVKFEVGLPPGRGYVLAANTEDVGYAQLAGPPN